MLINGRLLLNSPRSLTKLFSSVERSIFIQQSKLNPPQCQPKIILVIKNKNDFINLTNSIRTISLGGPGYTKFGHIRPKMNLSKYGYFWWAFLTVAFTFVIFFDFESFIFRGEEPSMKWEDYKKMNNRMDPKAKGKSDDDVANLDDESNNNSKKTGTQDDDDSVEKKSKNNSFRQRKIIEYENRIRMYSTPDKIFRYFATVKVWNPNLSDYAIFMTPQDFVRSITYGVMQPEGLGLDSYDRFDPNMQKLDLKINDDSVFKKLSKNGLIGFSDYILLVTLLSTPQRHFEIAFHMFDLDGNGNIDLSEFEHLQSIIRSQTSIGQRHKDTRMTGSIIKENIVLNDYFFGKNRQELLTVQKFSDFQKQIQDEVIKMEFEFHKLKKRSNDGTLIISETIFCEMIMAYAGMSSAALKKTKKRIAHLYDGTRGITFQEYKDFFQVLRSIHDIDTALKFYAIAGASIDKTILKHVANIISNVELSDHVIDVVFDIFDENGDQKLSNKEFIRVMKKRYSRGLQTRKDTGFINFIESASECANELLFSS